MVVVVGSWGGRFASLGQHPARGVKLPPCCLLGKAGATSGGPCIGLQGERACGLEGRRRLLSTTGARRAPPAGVQLLPPAKGPPLPWPHCLAQEASLRQAAGSVHERGGGKRARWRPARLKGARGGWATGAHVPPRHPLQRGRRSSAGKGATQHCSRSLGRACDGKHAVGGGEGGRGAAWARQGRAGRGPACLRSSPSAVPDLLCSPPSTPGGPLG